MKQIWIVNYTHKHGSDITAWESLSSAEKCAEEVRTEWWPKAKTYQEIIDESFGVESVEILESILCK